MKEENSRKERAWILPLALGLYLGFAEPKSLGMGGIWKVEKVRSTVAIVAMQRFFAGMGSVFLEGAILALRTEESHQIAIKSIRVMKPPSEIPN